MEERLTPTYSSLRLRVKLFSRKISVPLRLCVKKLLTTEDTGVQSDNTKNNILCVLRDFASNHFPGNPPCLCASVSKTFLTTEDTGVHREKRFLLRKFSCSLNYLYCNELKVIFYEKIAVLYLLHCSRFLTHIVICVVIGLHKNLRRENEKSNYAFISG